MAAKKKPLTKKSPPKKSVKKPTAKKAKPTPAKKGASTSSTKTASKAKTRTPVRKAAPAKGKRAPKKAPFKARRPAVKKPRAKAKKAAPKPVVAENAAALALARTIARVALDKKGSDVVVLDVRERGALVGYDYVVLATGDSDPQLAAIAEGVDEVLRPEGRRPTTSEASPDWVLINYDDVVAHFLTPEKRGELDFEGMWADAARVSLKK
jgi:ribosome-associated protein